eukprot:jgi/Chlat1/5581/Chrsp369S00851
MHHGHGGGGRRGGEEQKPGELPKGDPRKHLTRANKKFRIQVLGFAAVAILDIGFALILYFALHNWDILYGPWRISEVWTALTAFRTDSLDLVCLAILRVASLVAIAHFAPRAQLPLPKKLANITREDSNGVEEEPLLPTDSAPKSDETAATKRKLSGMSKDLYLLGAFLLCTCFQLYTGAKCVLFLFPSEALEGSLMGVAVLWINLESIFTNRIVDTAQLARRLLIKVSSLPPPDRATQEGQLRGDKGVRDEGEVDQRSYLMRAIALAKDEWGLMLLGFVCLGATAGSNLVLPKYQGGILDRVIAKDPAGFKRDVVLLVIFSLITGLSGGVRGLCFSIVGKRIQKTLQNKLFQGIIIQDVAYFDATTSGELTSRLTNDVSAMAEPCNWMLSAIVRNFLVFVGGFIMCFLTSWKLFMLAFTTMAPVMHITTVYSRWSRNLNRARYAMLADANSVASEALGNIRTVRAFSTEPEEIKKFEQKTLDALKTGIKDALGYSGAVAINNWLDLGASVIILWYGGMLVMDGRLTIGRLITFQLYWGMIQNSYQSFMSVLTSLTRAAGAAQRVLSLVDALPDIDPFSGTKASAVKGDLQMDNVRFVYQMRPNQPVLQGITLHVAPGQVCALVGRSGGGKSTMVHLFMRFYDPTSGVVRLDGADLRSLNLRSCHQHMGLVAQETQMFATTVEGNIAYGVAEYTQEELLEASRLANAHDFISKFSDGYKTRVGERGVRLSGGQRQRIAIARMLLRKPKVLLLDEATSSLDTESEALVQKAIDNLITQGNRTVVLVAHRLSTVRNADSIAVIENGVIAEQGTHDQLLAKEGVYTRLVRRQLAKQQQQLQEDIDELGTDANGINGAEHSQT